MRAARRLRGRVRHRAGIGLIAAAVIVAAVPAWAEEAGEKFLGLPTLVWKIANFVVFFGLLAYFLARPLQAFFRTRKQAIAAQAEEAARAREQTVELQATMERRLAALGDEMAALKERLYREGERERDALERLGEAEAGRLVAQVEQEADRRVAQARRELAREAANVASDLALELLRRELTEEDRRRIFAAALERLEPRSGDAQS